MADDRRGEARLVAAAPELLKALKDLVQRVDTTPSEDGSNLDTAWAHGLIARIEGPDSGVVEMTLIDGQGGIGIKGGE